MKAFPAKVFCVVLAVLILLASVTTGSAAPSAPQGKDLAYANIGFIDDQEYTGAEITPGVTVMYGGTTLTQGKDYELSYSNNIGAGTATVTITGTGEYSGTRTAVFNIGRINISKATVKGLGNIIFDKNVVEYTQTLTVTYGGATLTKNVDYELWYYGNTDLGSAAVAIIGIGAYCGRVIKTFSVVHGGSGGISVPLSYAKRNSSSSLTVNGTVTFQMCNLNTEGMVSSYTVKNASGSSVAYKSISSCGTGDSGASIGTWTPDTPGTYTVSYTISGYTARISGGQYRYYPSGGGTTYTQKIIVSDYPTYSSGEVTAVTFDRYVEDGVHTLYLKADAAVSGSNTDSTILWYSTKSSVASVDEYGKVTLHKPGSATISAFSYSDPSLTAEIEITVDPIDLEAALTGIQFYRTETGYKAKLCTAKGTLANGIDYKVTYTEAGNKVIAAVTGCGFYTGQLRYEFIRPVFENFSATMMKTGDLVVEVAPGSHQGSAQIVAATYSAEGQLLDVQTAFVSELNGGFSDVMCPDMDVKGLCRVFFLEDGSWTPISAAAETPCVVMPTAEDRAAVCSFLREYIMENGTLSATIYKCNYSYGGFSIQLRYYTDDHDFNLSCTPSTYDKAYAFNLRMSADGVPENSCMVQRNQGSNIIFGDFYTNVTYYEKNDPVELYNHYAYRGEELDEEGAAELERECAEYYTKMLTVFSHFLESNGYSIADLGYCCFLNAE